MALFSKIQKGLSKTRDKMSRGFKGALGEGKLTEDTLDSLEELLISADINFEITSEIIDKIRVKCLGSLLSNEDLIDYLIQFTSDYIVTSKTKPPASKPHVVLILGVNGVGKTTSIAKMAHYYKSSGKKVILAAGDTFRAGAIDQLNEWSERIGVDIIKHQEHSDAAAVVYDAYQAAESRGHDILLIDTAGRLHNKDNLMEEMKKIIRVLKKHDENLPHEVLLVLDGNTGQNAIPQAQGFNEVQPLDGFVVTKLDGTAKGGALISTSWKLKVPVKWIGVGEKMEDLIPFEAGDYLHGLFGKETIEIPLEQQKIKDAYKGLEI